jgi:hypothetical protein
VSEVWYYVQLFGSTRLVQEDPAWPVQRKGEGEERDNPFGEIKDERLQALKMGRIGGGFDKLGIMVADGKDARSAGADNNIIISKDLEEMTHETASGWPVAGIEGKLAAAGLGSGITPRNL